MRNSCKGVGRANLGVERRGHKWVQCIYACRLSCAIGWLKPGQHGRDTHSFLRQGFCISLAVLEFFSDIGYLSIFLLWFSTALSYQQYFWLKGNLCLLLGICIWDRVGKRLKLSSSWLPDTSQHGAVQMEGSQAIVAHTSKSSTWEAEACDMLV